mmetsp:Transcript_14153/g.34334  ORF Transcript_14153/g.34334 Transcript_14153/m.34334 type:complete len:236 (-) Transcript_14153:1241-1948(-)
MSKSSSSSSVSMERSLPTESLSILPKKETPLEIELLPRLCTERSIEVLRFVVGSRTGDRRIWLPSKPPSRSLTSFRSSSDMEDSESSRVSLLLFSFSSFSFFSLRLSSLFMPRFFSLSLSSFFMPRRILRSDTSAEPLLLSESWREACRFNADLFLEPVEATLVELSARFKDDLLLDLEPVEAALVELSVRFKDDLFFIFFDEFSTLLRLSVRFSFKDDRFFGFVALAVPLPRLR